MRYFARGYDRAVGESTEACDRLLASGFRECTRETHQTLWRIADLHRKAELVIEDHAAIQRLSYWERVRAGV